MAKVPIQGQAYLQAMRALQDQKLSLETQNFELRDNILQLQRQIQSLQRNLKDKESLTNTQQTQYSRHSQLHEENSRLTDLVQRHQKQIVSLKESLCTKENELAKSNLTNSQLSVQIAEVTKEVSLLDSLQKRRINELETELNTVRKSNSSYSPKQQSLRESINAQVKDPYPSYQSFSIIKQTPLSVRPQEPKSSFSRSAQQTLYQKQTDLKSQARSALPSGNSAFGVKTSIKSNSPQSAFKIQQEDFKGIVTKTTPLVTRSIQKFQTTPAVKSFVRQNQNSFSKKLTHQISFSNQQNKLSPSPLRTVPLNEVNQASRVSSDKSSPISNYRYGGQTKTKQFSRSSNSSGRSMQID